MADSASELAELRRQLQDAKAKNEALERASLAAHLEVESVEERLAKSEEKAKGLACELRSQTQASAYLGVQNIRLTGQNKWLVSKTSPLQTIAELMSAKLVSSALDRSVASAFVGSEPEPEPEPEKEPPARRASKINTGKLGWAKLKKITKTVVGFGSKIIVPSTEGLDFQVAKDFDYTETTQHGYSEPDFNKLNGKYKHIRAAVDFGYHGNYVERRQAWQDKVVDSVVVKTSPQAGPWIVYTCGPMGAGKGYALEWMSNQGYFPLDNIVHIDPDFFKSVMPEWKGYTDINTEIAGGKCHRESCFMQEIAQEAAMENSQNIWIDGSLRDGDWFSKVYDDIRHRFPRYRIAIIYVGADEAVVRARCKSRELKTGRGVPEAELVSSLAAPDKTLGKLTSKVDFIARVNNNSSVPQLASVAVMDITGNWSALQSRFARTQASPTAFPKTLPSTGLQPFVPAHDMFDWTGGLNGVVTDITHQLSSRIPLSSKSLSSIESLAIIQSSLAPVKLELRVSPPYPVTMDPATRQASGIPLSARVFVQCSGIIREEKSTYGFFSRAATKLGKATLGLDVDDPFVKFVLGGGFLYFNSHGHVVGSTCYMEVTESRNQIQFGPCVELTPEAVKQTVPRLTKNDRLAIVTRAFEQAKGADRYAWMVPNEDFGMDNEKTSLGGYLYLFKDETAKYYPVLGADSDE